jgi:hypothetical protein
MQIESNEVTLYGNSNCPGQSLLKELVFKKILVKMFTSASFSLVILTFFQVRVMEERMGLNEFVNFIINYFF